MAENWLVGRKEIAHYMRVSWDTVRSWRRQYGCPVYMGPSGRPAAFSRELDQWLVSFSRSGEQGGKEGVATEVVEFS